jgi:CDP-paratose 2-epimerase
MKLLVTGICGFVGSTLARALQEQWQGVEPLTLLGVDNFSRPGSEQNRRTLQHRGIRLFHGDLRLWSDLDPLPPFDWAVDAAANPSVLAGVDGKTSSRQILDHNLYSTVNLLELCRQRRAGFILLSTSRVYSIPALVALPMVEQDGAFRLDASKPLPAGVSTAGLTEGFSTAPPVSLYGASKLASELLALEYGDAFGFPVWINRCGVLAGGGQFGRADQGIVSFWINAWLRKRPLKYIGFGGHGFQVRDALHPRDLVPLLLQQFEPRASAQARILNLGGGARNTFSLLQLSRWCEQRLGAHTVTRDLAPRPFDIPWMVMDAARARTEWQWQPQTTFASICEEIALHAESHEDWLELSADG